MKKILVVGDVHGKWRSLNTVLSSLQPDLCIVAGDFGWWPGYIVPPFDIERGISLENQARTMIHFIDGNHENHADLLEMAPRGSFAPVEITSRIIYQPRGSTLTLPDGRIIFFAGGGKSVDWKVRVKGRDWFPEEILEREHLPKVLPTCDIVISHTTPDAFGVAEYLNSTREKPASFWDLSPDPSGTVLDEVLDVCRPKLWIAAHFHFRYQGTCQGTEFHVLDELSAGEKENRWAFWL